MRQTFELSRIENGKAYGKTINPCGKSKEELIEHLFISEESFEKHKKKWQKAESERKEFPIQLSHCWYTKNWGSEFVISKTGLMADEVGVDIGQTFTAIEKNGVLTDLKLNL